MQLKSQASSDFTREKLQILSHMNIVFLDDGQGRRVKTIRFTGVNVQIVNGLGATNGFPANPESTFAPDTRTNGLGNLIVGYNEMGNPNGDDRTGSHYLVAGHGNSYSSFGGLVVAQDNTASSVYATVSGGWSNVASGPRSTVGGGLSNHSAGNTSAVSGGRSNTASGDDSAVSGGASNVASGLSSWSGGGNLNEAQGDRATVVGGIFNLSSGTQSAVTGGETNTASGFRAVVSGGRNRSALGPNDWVAGSLQEDQ